MDIKLKMMDSKIKTVVISIHFIISTISAKSQTVTTNDYMGTPATLSGRILDKHFYNDTLDVYFWTHYIYGTVNGSTEHLKVIVGKNGKFTISLPLFAHPSRISVKSQKNELYLLSWQLIEPGDNIFLRINMENSSPIIHFAGKGAEKYSAWTEIAKKEYGLPLREDAMQMLRERDSVSNYLVGILSNYKLPTKIFEILKTDIICQGNNYTCITLHSLDSIARIQWNNEGLARMKNCMDTSNSETKLYSKYFLEYLFNLHRAFIYLSGQDRYTFKNLFDNICNTYQGELRDKLLLYLFTDHITLTDLGGVDENEFADYLQLAYSSSETPWIKEQILKRLQVFGKGADVYPFSLSDSTGHLVTLESLRGKIVLVDIWGNPCTGCLLFKQAFERDVYPLFKDRDDFVVLSVNINYQRERWLDGLQQYSSPDYINVYTSGLGSGHPLLEYYELTGVPSFLLIDRLGKLISSTIPLPHIRKKEQLIKLLRDSLNGP